MVFMNKYCLQQLWRKHPYMELKKKFRKKIFFLPSKGKIFWKPIISRKKTWLIPIQGKVIYFLFTKLWNLEVKIFFFIFLEV